MAHYFVNNHSQPNGDHEVHMVGCARMPCDKRYLGNFPWVGEALMEARKDFWQSSGCVSCSREYRQGSETRGNSWSAGLLRARFR